MKKEGAYVKKKYEIVNYIEVDGKDVPMESLTPEQRREVAQKCQDAMMKPMGYIRKTA